MAPNDDDAPERGELGEVTVHVHRAPSPDDDPDEHDPIRDAPPPVIRPAEILARATRLRMHPDITIDDADDAHTLQISERSLLDTALHAARHTIEVNTAECDRLRMRIAELDEASAQARTIVADIEARLERTSER